MNRVALTMLVGLAVWAGSGSGLRAEPPTLDELLDLEPAPAEPRDDAEPAASQGDAADTPEATNGEAAEATDGSGQDGPGAEPATEPEPSGLAEALTMDQAGGVFEQAVTQMHGVSRRLGRSFDPGLDTQREAQEVLRKLDQVIAAARAQQQGSSGASSASSREQDPGSQQQPLPQRGEGAGAVPGGETAGRGGFSPGAVGPVSPGVGDLEELRKEWGSLPPRLRQELTEGLEEPFSPVYRELTERFYRRVAESGP